jgi:hypothetical protein
MELEAARHSLKHWAIFRVDAVARPASRPELEDVT